MKITKLSDLKLDAKNANLGTDRGRKMLKQSLAELGAGRSILADKHGNVIAGNKTLETARDLKRQKVRVVRTTGDELIVVQRTDLDIDSKKARKLAVADNRVAEVDLQWNPEMLGKLDLELGDYFNDGELRKLLGPQDSDEGPAPQIDRAAELQQKWKTERGQIWEIGKHRLMCGDSYDVGQREELIGKEKPALMNTDPPYGINIVSPLGTAGGSKPFGSTVKGGTARRSSTGFDSRVGTVQRGPKSKNQIIQSTVYPVIHGDEKDFEPAQFLNLAKVTVLWGANYFATKLPHSPCWICWDKRENLTRNTFADCELAWCSEKSGARVFYHLWSGLYKGSQYGERRTHPTEKPVALFSEIGKMYAPEGLWLDLFAGSGAQLVAAEQSGATCYACEWEPQYVAVALERMADMGLKPRLAKS